MKQLYTTLVAVIAIVPFSYAQSYLPLTAGSTNPLTGTLYSTSVEAARLNGNNTYLSGYDNTGSNRTGYLQFNAGGSVTLAAENAANIALNAPKVGIGTLYPTRLLSLQNADNNTYMSFNNSGAEKWCMGNEGTVSNRFVIYGGTTADYRLAILNNGNVGIGTTNPNFKLDVSGVINAIGYMSNTQGVYVDGGTNLGVNNHAGTNYLSIRTNGVDDRMIVDPNGNVGIATTDTKGYRFAVNGNAIATSVTVKSYGTWPDFVFKNTYKLPSLLEVKNYIDKNQRLPEMPSEEDVNKNGINLGEIVKLQTKKIEELTLYLIEKEKQLAEQNAKNEQQQKVNESLQHQIDLLAKKL